MCNWISRTIKAREHSEDFASLSLLLPSLFLASILFISISDSSPPYGWKPDNKKQLEFLIYSFHQRE